MIKQREGKSIQPKKGRTALSRFDGLVTRRLSKGCDGMCPANCNFLLRARVEGRPDPRYPVSQEARANPWSIPNDEPRVPYRWNRG